MHVRLFFSFDLFVFSGFSVPVPRFICPICLYLSVFLFYRPCIPLAIPFSMQTSIFLCFVWHQGSYRLTIPSPAASCILGLFSNLDRYHVIIILPLLLSYLPDAAASPPSYISVLRHLHFAPQSNGARMSLVWQRVHRFLLSHAQRWGALIQAVLK